MPTHFFRVDGADQETGEETYLVLQAESKPQAEKIARKQGLLISSVRIAKPDDWQPATGLTAEEESEAFPDPSPDAQATEDIVPPPDGPSIAFIEARATAPVPQPPPAPAPAPASSAPGGSAAAIILGCAAGAMLLGGVLALSLALWPNNAARNELQQLDFRLNQLIQTLLGSTLVLGGLIVFVLTAHLRPRRRSE